MSDLLKLGGICMLFFAVGNPDREAAIVTENMAQSSPRPFLYPGDAPRCPRRNSAGQELASEIALRADGGEWVYDCRYQ